MSTTTKLNKVMITFEGAYDEEALYDIYTVITYSGSSYITLKEVTGVTPADDGVHYQLMAAHGVHGEGAVDSVNTQVGAVVLGGSHLLLTGYTMAGSASAVAATDTVNQAFGKLQKTVDGVEALLAAL